MSERAIIEKQLQKKISEVQGLEERLKSAKVYVKALEDVLSAIDRGQNDSSGEADVALRKGSLVARARDAILHHNAPIHIDDLLEALGREVTRDSKASLAGSIAAYVRKEEIFTRPAPSTFGLIELGHHEIEDEVNNPPEGFGYSPSKPSSRDLDEEIPF